MIEFAAGIMVGGSVGAVIMGALLAQTRAIAADVRHAAGLQASAPLQAPRHVASTSPRRHDNDDALPLFVSGRGALATASATMH